MDYCLSYDKWVLIFRIKIKYPSRTHFNRLRKWPQIYRQSMNNIWGFRTISSLKILSMKNNLLTSFITESFVHNIPNIHSHLFYKISTSAYRTTTTFRSSVPPTRSTQFEINMTTDKVGSSDAAAVKATGISVLLQRSSRRNYTGELTSRKYFW